MDFIEKIIENNIICDTDEKDIVSTNKILEEENEIINISDKKQKERNRVDLSVVLKRPPSCGLIIVDNFYHLIIYF